MAAITTLTNEVTSWRTRPYAMRAVWMREIITREEVEVSHLKRDILISGALTKTLTKVKLDEARARLRLTLGNQ